MKQVPPEKTRSKKAMLPNIVEATESFERWEAQQVQLVPGDLAEAPAHGRSAISISASDILPLGPAVAASMSGTFARATSAGCGRSPRREFRDVARRGGAAGLGRERLRRSVACALH